MKNHLLILTACLLLLFLSASPCFAKAWRNITPLLTTRAEVLQLFGNPTHNWPDNSEYFDRGTEVVTFKWIHPTCRTQNPIADVRSIQPNDLVLSITIKPKTSVKLKDLGIEKTPSISYADWLSEDVDCLGSSESGWNCTIFNGREGYGYATSKDGVSVVYFFPSDEEAKDWDSKHKSC